MAEQHATNPLPVGRYWIDVVDKPSGSGGVDDWDAWTLANASKVSVETSEDTPAQGGNPHRLFAIFNVKAPVFFPSANFGFPSFAPATIKSEADTIDAPDVPSGPGLGLPSFADLAGALPLVLLVIVLLSMKSVQNREREQAA